MDAIASDKYGDKHGFALDHYADCCPYCGTGNAYPPLVFRYVTTTRATIVLAAFQCAANDCQQLFVATYLPVYSDISGALISFRFHHSEPPTIRPVRVSETIAKLSADFEEIYKQSAKAEQLGLHEVAGVGYRKALEFVIKDYLIRKHPDKKDEIQKRLLGNCIRTFVTEERIKQCAERAAWLGNDETHYSRKWEDKDIRDLKALIRLTVHWIESEVETAEYLSDMPERK